MRGTHPPVAQGLLGFMHVLASLRPLVPGPCWQSACATTFILTTLRRTSHSRCDHQETGKRPSAGPCGAGSAWWKRASGLRATLSAIPFTPMDKWAGPPGGSRL